MKIGVKKLQNGNVRIYIETDKHKKHLNFNIEEIQDPIDFQTMTINGSGTATGITECDNPDECHDECIRL